jgi:transposase
VRASVVDPYLGFLREVLDQHPRLRATRIYQMARDRGYAGGVGQLRRAVARLRPQIREPFLRLQTFPGEQAQVDWAHFGQVQVGRARRALSCFVMTLSYSRALYLEFFFDQTMENFLRGHVRAFQVWGGQPRVILYDFVPGHKIIVLWRVALCGHWRARPHTNRLGGRFAST